MRMMLLRILLSICRALSHWCGQIPESELLMYNLRSLDGCSACKFLWVVSNVDGNAVAAVVAVDGLAVVDGQFVAACVGVAVVDVGGWDGKGAGDRSSIQGCPFSSQDVLGDVAAAKDAATQEQLGNLGEDAVVVAAAAETVVAASATTTLKVLDVGADAGKRETFKGRWSTGFDARPVAVQEDDVVGRLHVRDVHLRNSQCWILMLMVRTKDRQEIVRISMSKIHPWRCHQRRRNRCVIVTSVGESSMVSTPGCWSVALLPCEFKDGFFWICSGWTSILESWKVVVVMSCFRPEVLIVRRCRVVSCPKVGGCWCSLLRERCSLEPTSW